MRMAPTRYLDPRPMKVKPAASTQVKHLSAPLKGLSLESKLVETDPLLAVMLDNWVVRENRIEVRPGYHKRTKPDGLGGQTPVQMPAAVETLVPYYGGNDAIAPATAAALFNTDGTVLRSGFNGGDWSWTAFSNLGQFKFTVMVNGHDGVWSWDGGVTPAGTTYNVVSISKATSAVVTVSSTDITHFSNGMEVEIAGATGGFAVCNGVHIISSVGSPANTFTLPSIDTSAATGTSGAGITVRAAGSVVQENVVAPSTDTWVDVNALNVVLSHKNRLFFADQANMAIFYLPIQQKFGTLAVFPLNEIFQRGGNVVAMMTWTLDGGRGLEDHLVIFTSHGEAAIYAGIDPSSDFSLIGIYHFDSPMSKHSVVNYGGDLWVLISTGFVPLSTMMRSESEKLGKADRTVYSEFQEVARQTSARPGWAVILDQATGWMINNMPVLGIDGYQQMVRFMPNPIWARWKGIPARCWQWLNGKMMFGDDDGFIYDFDAVYLSDDNDYIEAHVVGAWSSYGTPAQKQFKMILPYITTDGDPKPFVQMEVDYKIRQSLVQPDITQQGTTGATWDTATWDVDSWAGSTFNYNLWQGAERIGRVGAPHMCVRVKNCKFSLAGWDIEYESGSIFG